MLLTMCGGATHFHDYLDPAPAPGRQNDAALAPVICLDLHNAKFKKFKHSDATPAAAPAMSMMRLLAAS
jgi:hypothetical protein